MKVDDGVFGEAWAASHASDKKTALVEQLDRAFADPDRSGRTPDQIAKLKGWTPAGMSFDIAVAPKARARKARKAA